jgi:hypothetical protein
MKESVIAVMALATAILSAVVTLTVLERATCL